MASKGDKNLLEPQAMRLYADGNSLSAIADHLGVSATSLSRWKKDSHKPGQNLDEWERARAEKKGNVQRLRTLFNEQMSYLEELHPSERTSPMMDTLAKIGALVERWDKMEQAQRVAEEVVKEVKKAGVSAESEDYIRAKILGIAQ